MARRSAPEVNAGSMADIAFLLLIFFLVTTTMEKDKGISRQLPPIQETPEEVIIKDKNLFVVLVNKNDDLLVEDEPMQLKDLRQAAIDFLDNGGVSSSNPLYCNYCQGKRDPSSSDNPDKAIISVKNDRLTSYNMYIAVQNELVGAYNFLRNRESQRLYGWDFTTVKAQVDAGTYVGDKKQAEEKLKEIQLMYPLKLSEASPGKVGK